MTDFTNTEKLASIERELSFRHRVYERRVTEKKMRQSTADHEIAVFEAIRDDYRALAEKEKLL